MNCACHDEPQYWTRDNRYRLGGFWRCAVRKRDYESESYDPLEKRRNDLRRLRASVLSRLAELEQEAQSLVSQP